MISNTPNKGRPGMIATGTKNKRIIPAIISRIFTIGNKTEPSTRSGIPIIIAGTIRKTRPTEKDTTTPTSGNMKNIIKPTTARAIIILSRGFSISFPFILIAIAITSS